MIGIDLEKIDNVKKMTIHIITIWKNQDTLINMIRDNLNIPNMKPSLKSANPKSMIQAKKILLQNY